jgi:hypothetical protein
MPDIKAKLDITLSNENGYGIYRSTEKKYVIIKNRVRNIHVGAISLRTLFTMYCLYLIFTPEDET